MLDVLLNFLRFGEHCRMRDIVRVMASLAVLTDQFADCFSKAVSARHIRVNGGNGTDVLRVEEAAITKAATLNLTVEIILMLNQHGFIPSVRVGSDELWCSPSINKKYLNLVKEHLMMHADYFRVGERAVHVENAMQDLPTIGEGNELSLVSLFVTIFYFHMSSKVWTGSEAIMESRVNPGVGVVPILLNRKRQTVGKGADIVVTDPVGGKGGRPSKHHENVNCLGILKPFHPSAGTSLHGNSQSVFQLREGFDKCGMTLGETSKKSIFSGIGAVTPMSLNTHLECASNDKTLIGEALRTSKCGADGVIANTLGLLRLATADAVANGMISVFDPNVSNAAEDFLALLGRSNGGDIKEVCRSSDSGLENILLKVEERVQMCADDVVDGSLTEDASGNVATMTTECEDGSDQGGLCMDDVVVGSLTEDASGNVATMTTEFKSGNSTPFSGVASGGAVSDVVDGSLTEDASGNVATMTTECEDGSDQGGLCMDDVVVGSLTEDASGNVATMTTEFKSGNSTPFSGVASGGAVSDVVDGSLTEDASGNVATMTTECEDGSDQGGLCMDDVVVGSLTEDASGNVATMTTEFKSGNSTPFSGVASGGAVSLCADRDDTSLLASAIVEDFDEYSVFEIGNDDKSTLLDSFDPNEILDDISEADLNAFFLLSADEYLSSQIQVYDPYYLSKLAAKEQRLPSS